MNRDYEELEKLIEDGKLKDEVALHLVNFWKYLNVRKYYGKDSAIKLFINGEKGKVDFVDEIETELFQLNGKQILDVGCGKGGVVISCALRGAKAFGFDNDEDEIRIAKLRAKSCGVNDVSIFKGKGEHIPFPDNFFDLITATSVLEHVENLEKVIKEMVRVLKTGGFICITCPNPLFPREAHYKVFYIPYLPKKLGKIYLKARGFNPDFFMQGITYPYPSPPKLKAMFQENGVEAENITEKDILTKFEHPTLINTDQIRNVVKHLEKLRINNLVAKLIVRLRFYPGVCIIAKKGDTK